MTVIQPAEGMRGQLSHKEYKHSFGPFLETDKTQEKMLLWANYINVPFPIFLDDLLKIFTCIYLGYWDILQ